MKKLSSRYLWIVCILLLIPSFVTAVTTTLLVDVSGSMNGISNDRAIQSFGKVKDEISSFARNNKDTIQIVIFTDKVIDSFVLITANNLYEEKLNKIMYPRKGNTNMNVALNYLNDTNAENVVIISDGRHNVGNYKTVVDNIRKNKNRNLFFLLLDETDLETPLIKECLSSNDITIIRSLSEIPNNTIENPQDCETKEISKEFVDEYKPNVVSFKIFMWIIIGLLIVVCLCVLLKLFIVILPLFKMASAGAIQKGIIDLYNLPKPLFNLIFKFLPSKMQLFLNDYMPKYDQIKRGVVIPKNEAQKQTLQDWKNQTGKNAEYKNGEPDFEPVSEYVQSLDGTLDDNIPKGTDPRKNVSKAQDKAANLMLSSRDGRKKIADYVGKNPKDIDYNDYTCWKDDALNQGKPNHNPKTPHESIDGKKIMWVPKRYHDVAWGGIDHYGGVSMLKSVRNFFGLNV